MAKLETIDIIIMLQLKQTWMTYRIQSYKNLGAVVGLMPHKVKTENRKWVNTKQTKNVLSAATYVINCWLIVTVVFLDRISLTYGLNI